MKLAQNIFRVVRIGVFGVALLVLGIFLFFGPAASRIEVNPVLRARINERIATLKKESLDQSFEQLINDDQQYFWPDYHVDVLGAQLDLERMLSTRRSPKVLQSLAKLTPIEREAKCKQLFATAFQAHTNAEYAVLQRRKDPSSPAPKVHIEATRLALCAAMFATADFGQRDILSDQFAQLDRFRVGFSPLLGTSFMDNVVRDWALPDNRFQVNVLRLLAERDPSDGGKLLRQVVEECAKANMKEKSIPVVGWDAQTTWFEKRFVGSMDTKKGVKTYVTVDWAIADLNHNKGGQEKALQKVRSIVFQ